MTPTATQLGLGTCQVRVSLPALSPGLTNALTIYLIGHPNRGSNLRAYPIVAAVSDSQGTENSLLAPLPTIPGLPQNVIGLDVRQVYASYFSALDSADSGAGAAPALMLVSDNEPAEMSRAVLGVGGPNEAAIAVADADACCLDSDSIFNGSPAGTLVGSYFLTPAEYEAELTAQLQLMGMGSPQTKSRYFFAALDRATNPNLGSIGSLAGPIGTLLFGLKYQRLITRRGVCIDCNTNCPDWPGPSAWPNEVTTVSQLLLGLMQKYLGDPSTPEGLASIETTFEQFANGDLRMQLPTSKVWTAQPSSALYFLLAEFAFVAWDNSISPAIWESLANVLVRTQEIYCSVYKPASPVSNPPGFGEYGACNFCSNTPFDKSKIQALRSSYNGLSISDLRRRAACNARTLLTC